MISGDKYLLYVDDALDDMVEILTGLGSELANRRPDLPGANSPYAIVTHCLGVMEFWAGHVIAGRPDERDRDAEFVAEGRVADLVDRVRVARQQLAADMVDLEPDSPPRNPVDRTPARMTATQGGVLMHVYEELAQHRGHLELTRDVLRVSASG